MGATPLFADAKASNLEKAIEFLVAVTGTGRLMMTYGDALNGGLGSGVYFDLPAQTAALRAWLSRQMATEHCNVYWALNEPVPADQVQGKNGIPLKADIARIRGVAVDIDPDGSVPFAEAREKLRQEARDKVAGLALQPTLAVDSGGGVQLFWMFPVSIEVSKELVARVEKIGKKLAGMLGGDAVQSVQHVFRVPYTTNWPDEKKRAAGRGKTFSNLWLRGEPCSLEALTTFVGADEQDAQAETPELDVREEDIIAFINTGRDGGWPEMWCLRAEKILREHSGTERSKREFAIAGFIYEQPGVNDLTAARFLVSWAPEKYLARGFSPYLVNTLRNAKDRAQAKAKGESKAWTDWDRFFDEKAAKKAREVNSDDFVNQQRERARADKEKRQDEFRKNRIRLSDLEGKSIPVVDFLVGGNMFPMNNLTLLSGPGGSGKTTLLLDLQIAAAIGLDTWKGSTFLTPAGGHRCLFYSAEEDTDIIHMRTANMLPFYNCTFKDLANITFHDRSIEPATLIQLDKTSGKVVTTDQFDMLEADIAELKPTIVVIDNRSQIFSGNENDRTAAQEACRPLQRLARTYKCAIILAMHPSLAGIREGTGHSGTTGWEGAVRQFDYLSFLNEDDRSSGVRLEIVKTNYGAPGGDPIELVWRNGFMENANLYVGDKPAPGKRRAEIKAERVFIKLLRRNTQRGLPISPSPTSQLYAPRIFERDKEREGLQKKHFELAMHALMDSGRVVVEVRWGLNKNKVRVLVEVEDFMGK